MNKIEILLTFLIGIVVIQNCSCGVTDEQLAATGKLMRDVCLPKFPKVTADVADKIKEQQYPSDKDGKCYINCVMEMMQSMKKGKYNYDASLKQVDLLLPDNLKDDYRKGLTACKGKIDGIKNQCDGALELLKCFQANIPKFLFP